jgi:hypothetical protein
MPEQQWFRAWTTWQPAERTAWIVVAVVGALSVLLISVALLSSGASSPTLAEGSGLSQSGSVAATSTSTTAPVVSQVGPGTGSPGSGSSGTGSSGTGSSGTGSSGTGSSGTGSSGTGSSGTGTSGSGTSGSGTLATGTGSSGTGSSGSGAGTAANQPSVGTTKAPAGSDSAIEAGVGSPPGPVVSVVTAKSDPTYAIVQYGGTPSTLALLHQSGSGWTVLAKGSPQLPCVNGLPVGVETDFLGWMQACG